MSRQYELQAGVWSEGSRRNFLKGTAALAMAGGLPSAERRVMGEIPKRRVRAYVGTYSAPRRSGAGGNGKGIYIFEVDAASGALLLQDIVVNTTNPTWMAFNARRTRLYAGNEIGDFQGTHSGSVSAYAVDPSSGRLSLLNTVSSEGAGVLAYLSVHPSGRYVLVAGGETISVLPIQSNGELGSATDVKHDRGRVGSDRPTDGPPGNFAISGHKAPHPHMIQSDPQGRYVLNTDLGLDRIFIWTLDLENGKLAPHNPHSVSLPSGDGPRHFVFHPTGPWMYSVQEEASTLVLFDYDAEKGTLTPRQTVSALPEGFAGTSFASEVSISSDGRFLYAANRLHDSISWFSIRDDGALQFSGNEWTRGDYPRSFNFDPSERYIYSCNQRADAVTLFKRDSRSGKLTFTGRYTPVGTPAVILFAE